jgi:rhamnosyltransferase
MKIKGQFSYCAVIIWYNPSQSDIANTHNLAEIIPCVLVIDNSDRSNSSHVIKANIQYYPLYNNLGIASALNYGFQKAVERGFKYVLSLDQDSNFNAGNLQRFEERASQLFKDPSTAIVAASFEIDEYNVKPCVKKTNITSGSMTSLVAWEAIGRFKDDFFIDHVDHEFCLRLNQRNFLIYQLPDVYMQHALGYPKTRKLLGKIYTSPGYSADRLYYYYRNRLYLAKYRKESFHSVSMFLCRKARLILLVEDKRLPKIVAMLTGVAHYLMKKSGPRKSRRK